MEEYQNNSLEIDIKDDTKEENKKEFKIELLIYNKINDSQKKDETEEKNEFIDNEEIILDIPINYKDGKEDNSSNEYYIKIIDLKNILKKKGYPIATSKIYIYIDNNVEDCVFINDDKEIINSYMITKDNIIKLKLLNNLDKKLINNSFNYLKNHFSNIEKNNKGQESSNESKNKETEINIEFNKRKRKIGYIVKSVYQQRMLYNGYYGGDGTKVKYDLKEASDIVGIPPKTLDDYLKEIRKARKRGFDFNKYKDEDISFLRGDNKLHEKSEKKFLNKKTKNKVDDIK